MIHGFFEETLLTTETLLPMGFFLVLRTFYNILFLHSFEKNPFWTAFESLL
jgi:hypothetical protein